MFGLSNFCDSTKTMTRYIFKRILFFIPVLFVISVLNFALYSAAPGDPVTVMYSHLLIEGGDQVLTGKTLANIRARLGLDKPWPVAMPSGWAMSFRVIWGAA